VNFDLKCPGAPSFPQILDPPRSSLGLNELTLLVPGVDSSRVPGFIREFFLKILYNYGKTIGNKPQ
jgi:hypothetical protein